MTFAMGGVPHAGPQQKTMAHEPNLAHHLFVVLKKFLFIHLAPSGRCCGVQDLSLWRAGFSSFGAG